MSQTGKKAVGETAHVVLQLCEINQTDDNSVLAFIHKPSNEVQWESITVLTSNKKHSRCGISKLTLHNLSINPHIVCIQYNYVAYMFVGFRWQRNKPNIIRQLAVHCVKSTHLS